MSTNTTSMSDNKLFFIESHINGAIYCLTGFYDDSVMVQPRQSEYEYIRKQLWMEIKDPRGILLKNLATGKVLSRSWGDDWGNVILKPVEQAEGNGFCVWELLPCNDKLLIISVTARDSHHLNIPYSDPNRAVITYKWDDGAENELWTKNFLSSSIVSSETTYHLNKKIIITDPNQVSPLHSQTELLINGTPTDLETSRTFKIEGKTTKSFSITKTDTTAWSISQELGMKFEVEGVYELDSKTTTTYSETKGHEFKNEEINEAAFTKETTYAFKVPPYSKYRAFQKLERGKLIIPFDSTVTYLINNHSLVIKTKGEFVSTDNLDIELTIQTWDPDKQEWMTFEEAIKTKIAHEVPKDHK